MNVLIIHQHFKTPQEGGALRSYFLAKALVEKGNKVTVVTGSNQSTYHRVHLEGVDVHYLPVAYSNYFGFWKRIFSFLKFVLAFIWRSGKFRDADVCYAISVPLTVGLASLWMLKKYNIPYIFEVGDLWPDAAIELGVIQNQFLKDRLWKMERRIYGHASSIVALSPTIREAIERKISGKKILVIPNVADTEFFKPEPKREVLEEKYGVNGKFVVSYFGAMGFANGLDYLLACALACQKEKLPVQFLMAGDGAEKINLEKKSAALGLTNLSFHSFKNREGIHDLMNITDAVFVCYRQAAILETGSPNKFFDGLAAGKLILINFDGWLRKEIEAAQCGFYLDPEKPESIVPVLKSIKGSNQLSMYQERSRHLAEQKFSRKKLTEQWADTLFRSSLFASQSLHGVSQRSLYRFKPNREPGDQE